MPNVYNERYGAPPYLLMDEKSLSGLGIPSLTAGLGSRFRRVLGHHLLQIFHHFFGFNILHLLDPCFSRRFAKVIVNYDASSNDGDGAGRLDGRLVRSKCDCGASVRVRVCRNVGLASD